MSAPKPAWTNLALLLLRVMLGFGMATHGYGKIFGGHMDAFTIGVAKMGFPLPNLFAWAAALSELAGGILVFFGAWTRAAAFFIFATMTAAAFIRHGADPFAKRELALVYWSIAGALVLLGPGGISLEAMRRKAGSRRAAKKASLKIPHSAGS